MACGTCPAAAPVARRNDNKKPGTACAGRASCGRDAARAYLTAFTMYSTAARISAADALAALPLGGMAPLPVMATFTMASMPVLIYGSQAALSPYLGALATPVPRQA